MKTNCWLVLGTMIATTAVAQVNTNTLPAIPAPATAPVVAPVVETTNAPAPVKKKSPAKKKAVKKISEPTVTLVAGPAMVESANLNLRGQAGLKGEVVGHLKKGDTLTVISQINLDKHAADEPAQWAKVSLPAGTKVWVNSRFVDSTNKVVTVKKLNFRAGPGENYSVLGVLEKGASISEVSSKGAWTEIEAPTSAFAFAAAMFLKQEAAAPVVTETPAPVPAPTPTTVAEASPVNPTPAPAPAPAPETAAAPANAAPVLEGTNAVATVDTNPPPPRVVSHEGYIRRSMSLVAPTEFELFDWQTGKAINYIYSPTTNLNLAKYDSYKVIVTGEEGMAERWAATPVLTIQKIYVLETNYPQNTSYQRVSSPRAQDQTTRGTQPKSQQPQSRR